MKKAKVLSAFAASIIAASMMTVSAGAAEPPASTPTSGSVYTGGIEGTKITKFDKYLVMKKDAVVPTASFSFTIEPGSAVDADPTENTLNVFAGVGAPKFLLSTVTNGMEDGEEKTLKTNANVGSETEATVKFAPADTDSSTVTILESNVGSGKTVKFVTTSTNTDEKYAQKHIAIDFSDVAFPEPGVYRYIITEEAIAEADRTDGVAADTNATRVLDVVVVDASSEGTSKLKINNYVLHDSADDVPVKSGDTAAIAHKSSGFTNTYTTYDLQFSKSVSGNQASRDKYFKFELNITNAKGAEITVDGQGTSFDVAPSKGTNTAYEEDVMNEANTTDGNPNRDGQQLVADASGNINATFYIRHGQNVSLKGLPEGAKYTLTETEEDYTPVVTVTEANDGDAAANNDNNGITDTTTGIMGDTTAAFTNTKTGTIPTGIISTVAVSAVVVLLGLAGIIGGIFLKKKKSEEE